MKDIKKIENMIREVTKTLYQSPDLKVKVNYEKKEGDPDEPPAFCFDVHVSPFYAGLLIGSKGETKFAIERMIAVAAGEDADDVFVTVYSSGNEKVTKTKARKIDESKLEKVLESIRELYNAKTTIEETSRALLITFDMPKEFKSLGPALSKIIRDCGKASGFNAVPFIEHT